MTMFYSILILCIVNNFGECADLSPLTWFFSHGTGVGNPFHLLRAGTLSKKLGDKCDSTIECLGIDYAYCSEGKCVCQNGFTAGQAADEGCQRVNHLGIPCQKESHCSAPLTCSSGKCECPTGLAAFNNGEKCVQSCPHGLISVNRSNSNGLECLPVLELDAQCSRNEQCSTRYSQCLSGRCRCIQGTVRRESQCLTLKQCPIGEPPLQDGYPLTCDRKTLTCPEGNYCLFAQVTDVRGYCCPRLQVRCPVGEPKSYGCGNCPLDTHYCFSYTIGTHAQSMCCPNDCPRNLPIRQGDRCFTAVKHGEPCVVDEQCNDVKDSVCAGDGNSARTCRCGSGYALSNDTCKKTSTLGEECESTADCSAGSNTMCLKGYCQCVEGFMPEPTSIVEHCIAKPACPSVDGLDEINDYEDCSTDVSSCSAGKFCREWYFDTPKQKSYSLCCPIPSVRDYTQICTKFGMKMLLANSITDANSNAQPFRCMLPMQGLELFTSKKLFADAPTTENCPRSASCVFNPYTRGEGVCCHYIPIASESTTMASTTNEQSITETTSTTRISSDSTDGTTTSITPNTVNDDPYLYKSIAGLWKLLSH